MHISEKIVEYFANNGWIFVQDEKGVKATRTINFAHLAGQLSNGDRLVTILIDPTGRWMETVDGFGNIIADVDLRNYSEKTAYEAVADLVNKI